MMDYRSFVDGFLSFLEGLEARTASWGFYEVTWCAADIETALADEASPELLEAWREREENGETLASLIQEMQYAGLLHQVGDDRYRTRWAETVRLLSHLRQLFKAEDWSTGPRLVADLKLHNAPRRYPRRDIPAQACWQAMQASTRLTPSQARLFEKLSTGGDGRPLAFAGFQQRAFAHVLSLYGREGFSGSVVSAGTGSGKTKAFYVPALLGVAGDLARSREPFTKVIAIYPRNVLLADQLREALSEVAKLAGNLESQRLRKVTLGALLGATPYDRYLVKGAGGKFPVEDRKKGGWKRVQDGFVVPFVKSPVVPEADLVWRDADRKAGRTCLYRLGASEPDVADGVLVLTREQLQRRPPDILFLSLEMLNREMGNSDWARCFGIDVAASQGPRMLLLDEVHSYSGIPGAQAAWVLRRWRHWARPRHLHVVGLSATLWSPREHLANMTGLDPRAVEVFAPEESEFEAEGVEYSIALKGDPSAGASLLSTSIQAAMLLGRTQTPRLAPKDRGPGAASGDTFYGRKWFGFSDNLDVLNRWMADLRDAEQVKRLARLRQVPEKRTGDPIEQAVQRQMDATGQVWRLADALGYDLDQALVVSRCSSQDPGMDSAADLVVATASLEVGFDDPEVAGTLHHKRPRNMASFVQRKGRAGRRRGTRPWTVLILSDYGADRWAFQHAEKYFEPQIEAIALPIHNPHVLRIQATFLLVDWLGRQVRGGSPYRYLARPQSQGGTERVKAQQILFELLSLGPQWNAFRSEVSRVFRLPKGRTAGKGGASDADCILWDHPRPVMTQAVPALLRKLETNWGCAFGAAAVQDDTAAGRPLPGFLPGATFDDLDVAEVRLEFAVAGKSEEHLGVAHALSEVCPGRVSKRYSVGTREPGYWLASSAAMLEPGFGGTLSIKEAFKESLYLESASGFDVYQPVSVDVAARPAAVLDTCNSAWVWLAAFKEVGPGRPLPALSSPGWTRCLAGLTAFLHRDGNAIEVLRFAPECRYEIRRPRQDPIAGRMALVGNAKAGGSQPQAIGFRQQLDGLRLAVPASALQSNPRLDAATLARWRPLYFRERLAQSLTAVVNSFTAEWLVQVSLASLGAEAALHRVTLEEAQSRLQGTRPEAARRAMETIFGIGDASEAEEEGKDGKVVSRVVGLLSDPGIVERIEEAERHLWAAPDVAFNGWIADRILATLAQGLRAAAVTGLEDVLEDDFHVDVHRKPDGGADLYLAEQVPGGVGLMERVVDRILRAPERFDDLFEGCLRSCARDTATKELLAVVASAARPGRVSSILEAVRDARGIREADAARIQLGGALEGLHVSAARSSVVAVMTRVAGPGTSASTDRAIYLLNRHWKRLSRRLGCELDPRAFTHICLETRAIERRIRALGREVGQGVEPSRAQLAAMIQRWLWGTCEDACRECLDAPPRFVDYGRPARGVTLDWLGLLVTDVRADGSEAGWLDEARAELLRRGRVRVVLGDGVPTATLAQLQMLLTEEIVSDTLSLAVSTAKVERAGTGWAVTLRLYGGVDA